MSLAQPLLIVFWYSWKLPPLALPRLLVYLCTSPYPLDADGLWHQLHGPLEAVNGCLIGRDCAEDLHRWAHERGKKLSRDGIAHVTEAQATDVLEAVKTSKNPRSPFIGRSSLTFRAWAKHGCGPPPLPGVGDRSQDTVQWSCPE